MRKRLTVIAIAMVAMLASCLVGCGNSLLYSASYKLDHDDSLSTKWGSLFQYKVDSSWYEGESAESEDFASCTYSLEELEIDKTYRASDIPLYLSTYNTNSNVYSYISTRTYDGWIASKDRSYGTTPEERVEAAKANGVDANIEYQPIYSEYSLEEIGTQEAAGVEWRLYKLKVTVEYTDEGYENLKKSMPDAEQKSSYELNYAIVKDGVHDAEITATSEDLLYDFIDTLIIKW